MPNNLNELDQKIEVPVVVHSLSLRAQCTVQQVLGEIVPALISAPLEDDALNSEWSQKFKFICCKGIGGRWSR